MTEFRISGESIELPAVPLTPPCASFDPSAWVSRNYLSIRLTESIRALRVHTNGRAFPGREASHAAGRWLLIGDIILTSSEIADSRSLPTNDNLRMAAFTHVSQATLERSVVLNIGIASQKYAGRGGGFQAEYVCGPRIRFELLDGKAWHAREGFA